MFSLFLVPWLIAAFIIPTNQQWSFYEMKQLGDSCDNRRGICKRAMECPSGIEDIKRGLFPNTCGFEDMKPIICCKNEYQTVPSPHIHLNPSPPPVTIQQPSGPQKLPTTYQDGIRQGETSKRMCREYGKLVKQTIESPASFPGFPPDYIEVDSCGRIETPLIVGGVEAKSREFPHMALVGYGKIENINFLCGGSLVSDKFILSAAHCTFTSRGPAQWVKLGELVTNSDRDEADPIVIKIQERFNHPNFRKGVHYNDISLYLLERPVQFNEFIRPICLHNGESIVGKKLIVSGWGRTEFGGKLSKSLLKAEIQPVTTGVCNAYLFGSNYKNSLRFEVLDEIQLCAGGKGNDTCQGDSGGPLQVEINDPYCMYWQVGITSFGKGCGGLPGVYTRVSAYITWIESLVWGT